MTETGVMQHELLPTANLPATYWPCGILNPSKVIVCAVSSSLGVIEHLP